MRRLPSCHIPAALRWATAALGWAVLALAPSAEPIMIEDRAYRAVLVPTAPVPVGGGLLYVPVAWVKPAQIGMDRVISTYVSMGLTPPTATDTRPLKS